MAYKFSPLYKLKLTPSFGGWPKQLGYVDESGQIYDSKAIITQNFPALVTKYPVGIVEIIVTANVSNIVHDNPGASFIKQGNDGKTVAKDETVTLISDADADTFEPLLIFGNQTKRIYFAKERNTNLPSITLDTDPKAIKHAEVNTDFLYVSGQSINLFETNIGHGWLLSEQKGFSGAIDNYTVLGFVYDTESTEIDDINKEVSLVGILLKYTNNIAGKDKIYLLKFYDEIIAESSHIASVKFVGGKNDLQITLNNEHLSITIKNISSQLKHADNSRTHIGTIDQWALEVRDTETGEILNQDEN